MWVNFELVLARDDTVNASADGHENLLIALKGGSNNFGIVTRFHMTTFEQGKLWGGDVHYGTDQFSQQVQGLVDYTTDEGAYDYVHLLLSVGYAATFGGAMAKNSEYYTKPQVYLPTLQPFPSMPPQIEALKTLRLDTF